MITDHVYVDEIRDLRVRALIQQAYLPKVFMQACAYESSNGWSGCLWTISVQTDT